MIFRKPKTITSAPSAVPAHIGFIMDGNGRWAKKRGLPRKAGHNEGSKNADRITRLCAELGVKIVSLYAFSTENWKRPKEEVDALFDILKKFIKEKRETVKKDNVILRFMGDMNGLPQDLREEIRLITEETSVNTGIIINIAMNYGGRAEIVRAANEIVKAGGVCSEENISAALYTQGLVEPDLVIRTGGQVRLSNFMLWQAAYSELYFTPVLWPDFDEKQLYKAIEVYNGRKRNFGAI